MSLGFPEIVVILLIALLVFGPGKLPEIGRMLGRTLRELRRASSEFTSSIQSLGSEEEDTESCDRKDAEPK